MFIASTYDEWLAFNMPSTLVDLEAIKTLASAEPSGPPPGGGWVGEVVGIPYEHSQQAVRYRAGLYAYQDVRDSRFIIGPGAMLWLDNPAEISGFLAFIREAEKDIGDEMQNQQNTA